MFFVTICCENRGKNQLCLPKIAEILFNAARHYHDQQEWFLRLMLLMPDHLHAIIIPAPSISLGTVVGNWKRFVAKQTDIAWQKNFFDHRLRSNESWDEKAAYIRANPVRAGLIAQNETWPFQIQHRCGPPGGRSLAPDRR
jgi:REP element-mobilizing transposase RayT